MGAIEYPRGKVRDLKGSCRTLRKTCPPGHNHALKHSSIVTYVTECQLTKCPLPNIIEQHSEGTYTDLNPRSFVTGIKKTGDVPI